MGASFILDTRGLRDLSQDVITAHGVPKIMPASYYAGTALNDRLMLCVKHALYGLPTQELVDWLRRYIDGRPAIEIGAGTGALADAVGIPATDNFLQARPEIQAHYAALRQPTVAYGKNVKKLDALAATKEFRPQVVVASWFTHKFDPRNPAAQGNEFGVDEAQIIARCDAYVFIGNDAVHAGKPIWKLPHVKITPDWLYSRGRAGRNFIAVWRRDGLTPSLKL